jgi:hypothetical protein
LQIRLSKGFIAKFVFLNELQAVFEFWERKKATLVAWPFPSSVSSIAGGAYLLRHGIVADWRGVSMVWGLTGFGCKREEALPEQGPC